MAFNNETQPGGDSPKSMAVKLSSFDPKEVFSSKEPKASETATIIGHSLGVPSEFDKAWKKTTAKAYRTIRRDGNLSRRSGRSCVTLIA